MSSIFSRIGDCHRIADSFGLKTSLEGEKDFKNVLWGIIDGHEAGGILAHAHRVVFGFVVLSQAVAGVGEGGEGADD